MRLKAAIVLAGLTAASSVWSSPFSYDEATQGDLNARTPVILNVGAGVNTVDGTVGFGTVAQEAPNGYMGDSDPFVLRVAQGLHIHMISLTMKPINGEVRGYAWLVVPNGDFGRPVTEFRQSWETYAQSWVVDLGPGDYLLHQSSTGGNFESRWTHQGAIEATQVAAVPEPAAMTLLLAGLLFTVGATRRRR